MNSKGRRTIKSSWDALKRCGLRGLGNGKGRMNGEMWAKAFIHGTWGLAFLLQVIGGPLFWLHSLLPPFFFSSAKRMSNISVAIQPHWLRACGYPDSYSMEINSSSCSLLSPYLFSRYLPHPAVSLGAHKKTNLLVGWVCSHFMNVFYSVFVSFMSPLGTLSHWMPPWQILQDPHLATFSSRSFLWIPGPQGIYSPLNKSGLFHITWR